MFGFGALLAGLQIYAVSLGFHRENNGGMKINSLPDGPIRPNSLGGILLRAVSRLFGNDLCNVGVVHCVDGSMKRTEAEQKDRRVLKSP